MFLILNDNVCVCAYVRMCVRACCCIFISKVIFMHYCTGTLNFYRNYQMEVHVKTVWDSRIGR